MTTDDIAAPGAPHPDPFHPDAVSAETAAFAADLEAQLRAAPATHELPVEVTRRARDEGKGIFPFSPAFAEAEDLPIPGAPGGPGRVRIMRPTEGAPRGLFLHIHGGGWTFGRPWHFDPWTKYLADRAGCVVASVEYRLAPEHPWPACIEDCIAAARWAAGEGAASLGLAADAPVVIGGESAGAHLSAGALLAMKAEGRLARFAGALLTYGCFDLAGTPSLTNWGARPLILSTPVTRWFSGNLAIPPEQLRDPLVSPLWGDLSDMPPALFQCGTWDPLVDDTAFMSARWRAAGGAAETVWHPGGVHAFDCFDLAIARDARARAAAFVSRRFA